MCTIQSKAEAVPRAGHDLKCPSKSISRNMWHGTQASLAVCRSLAYPHELVTAQGQRCVARLLDDVDVVAGDADGRGVGGRVADDQVGARGCAVVAVVFVVVAWCRCYCWADVLIRLKIQLLRRK